MAGNLNLDLLFPHKYEGSAVLSALVGDLDELFQDIVDKIAGLAELVNPDLVTNEYMQYLADLLGATLLPIDSSSETDRRNELRQMIDWIKLKGTYQSVRVIENMLSTNFEFMDMYTNNYVDFVLVPWFVANYPGENPPGLDGSYYKSPHFGYQLKLNVKYDANDDWAYDYLYIPEWYRNMGIYVEKTRPIHTVPHYYVLIEPECDDDEAVFTKPGEIHTMVLSTWPSTRLYYDQQDSNKPIHDDGISYFDQHDEAFYDNVTLWKIGTGSKGLEPDEPGWTDLETIVSSGVVPAPVITNEKIVWTFTIPAQNQLGISELGLYSEGPDTIRVASLFPDINLAGNVDIRVILTVNRTTS